MSDAPTLQLYNTLTGKVEPFEPLEPEPKPGKVRMYVCGPTVYDHAHLGHARCYITWDVLYRFLKFLGYEVTYVRNVTDVDDKILNKAKDTGKTPAEIAGMYFESFTEDMDALNTLRPDQEPKATEYIGEMLAGIRALIEKNAAYITPTGSVYFRTAEKEDYGKLSKKPLDDLKAGARVEVDPEKESPLDFALWKAVSADDPYGWNPADYGAPDGIAYGRPGWHMECSAMNHAVFGERIDIHTGGADLIFPHHENEIAQSECWTGHKFANYWMHNGFVNVSGEKMSKSLGNFATVKDVLKRYDANTIRYFLLTNGYRMPVDFNDEALQGAENRIHVIHKSLKAGADKFGLGEKQLEELALEKIEPQQYSKNDLGNYRDRFNKAINNMLNDLNTAVALAAMGGLCTYVRIWPADMQKHTEDHYHKRLLQLTVTLFKLLGFDFSLIFQQKPLPVDALRTIYGELTGEWLNGDKAPEEWLKTILSYRKEAKKIKNYQQADAIRKHLTDIGLEVMDNKDGSMSAAMDGVEIVRV